MSSRRQVHVNSLENLTYHDGRPLTHGEPKKRREVTVTDTGWQGVQNLARSQGLSVSEMLERMGRMDANSTTADL